MLLQQIRNLVQGLPKGGYLSSDMAESYEFIDFLINTGRAVVLPMVFSKSKTKLPIWYQTYIPEFSKEFQDGYKGTVQFDIPDIIGLSASENGYGYIGGTQCNYQARIWTNRSRFTSWMSDKIFDPTTGRKMNILFEGSRHCEIYYGNFLVKEPLSFVGVYANPMELTSYNVLKDDYPLDQGSIKELVNYLEKTDMMILTKSFVDRVHQGKDDSKQPILK